MRRIERIPESIFGMENSSVDANRFYTILLDAKAANVSENMCDIAEKLLSGEKENAKIALEQLWNLKKNLITEPNSTIDLLINFYQDKMDILRTKEEHIKKVSRDSRDLLEEKRRRDEEFASIKQQIIDCNNELRELNSKLEKLKVKEQELSLIEQQLKQELNSNENEIVNGLYEIILSQQSRNQQDSLKEDCSLNQDYQSVFDTIKPAQDEVEKKQEFQIESEENLAAKEQQSEISTDDTETSTVVSGSVVKEVIPLAPPFPKSVVKTTRGRVIGEYYYDSSVYKNKRHYIFNSRYFYEQLSMNVKLLRQRFDQNIYSEIQKMIEDAHNRISESDKLHFEVSTNEILNARTLKKLWQDVKNRDIDEVDRFSNRLRAKIDMLGLNYTIMLQEQMKRCTEN
ncbi:MAG: hypothetical protein GX267_02045 [Fibrobacter sp.]|jgi:hypothetical protein|nr:hypothetical protein [Fibrobacter sp.]